MTEADSGSNPKLMASSGKGKGPAAKGKPGRQPRGRGSALQGKAQADRKKLSDRQKARRMLLQALYQWEMARAPVNEIAAEFLVYYQGKIDRDFFREVFPEVVRHVPDLDEQMTQWVDRDLKALDPIELSLLRLGVYELAHRIDIPYKVVINEAVELAKVFGATDSHKYINGVLDRASRQLRALEQRGSN